MNGIAAGHRGSNRAFTIVELLIVIVVIAILAAISIVAYTGMQARAQDARMRTGIVQFEKAFRLWALDQPLPIVGGHSSTVPASNGRCSDGANGWLSTGNYFCSVGNALESAGSLPVGFLRGLPKNIHFGDLSDGRYSTMLYRCGTDTNRYGLYWTLQNPSPEDSASIDSVVASCGPAVTRDTYGMRAAKIIHL